VIRSPSRSEGVDIRTAEAEDLMSVTALERSIYPSPWKIEYFGELLDLPGAIALVATIHPGEVVGYAMGWVIADEAALANIAVVADRRRQGIATRLLGAFRIAAGNRGARRVYLEVRESNRAALALYEHHGFSVVGRRPNYYRSPSEDGLTLAVDLLRGLT
jgi:ribosomal-protein-alanine N-acetyltransferase